MSGSPIAAAPPTGRYAAYGAFALGLLGLAVVVLSDSRCRFDAGAQNYVGSIGEPGATIGVLAFTFAPLAAAIALVALFRSRRVEGRLPRLATLAAIAVFPLAAANLLLWVAKGAFACGVS